MNDQIAKGDIVKTTKEYNRKLAEYPYRAEIINLIYL